MKWYQIKEYSAGNFRLKISFLLYKIFGIKILYTIAFLVTLVVFLSQKTLRKFSKKYLEIVSKYTNVKPNLINQFKHCYSYSKMLCDKIAIHSENYSNERIFFEDANSEKEVFNDIDKGNGVFFICSHLGCIDALRMFMKKRPKVEVNIFTSQIQSQTFNNFIKNISQINPVKMHNVDQIGVDTTIFLKDSFDNGNIAFIAGDRISEHEKAKCINAVFLGQNIKLPLGAFKLAKLMESPIYFIVAINENNSYKVIAQKHNFVTLDNLAKDYIQFLEKLVIKYPLQFYHFYDIFI